MSRNCGNPLLRDWVKEWMEQAQLMQNKSYYTFKKAYDSLCRCPVTFSHPAEARQLEGIGVTLAQRLTEKMIQHCEEYGLPPISRSLKSKRRVDTNDSQDIEAPSGQSKRRKKAYVPTYRSGAYAILLCLQDMQATGRDSLTKEQICTYAQQYCNVSMTLAEPGKSYTAFNGVKTLMEKGYVYKGGRPVKYMLTDTGLEMANKLRNAGDGSALSQPLSQTLSQPSSQPPYEPSSQPLSQTSNYSQASGLDRVAHTIGGPSEYINDRDQASQEMMEDEFTMFADPDISLYNMYPSDNENNITSSSKTRHYTSSLPSKDTSPIVVNLEDDSEEDEIDLLSGRDLFSTIDRPSSPGETMKDISPSCSPLNLPQSQQETLSSSQPVDDVFHFTYLSASNEPVKHASSASVEFDEINGCLCYLIRFYAKQRDHPKASNLTQIERDGNNTLIGYLSEIDAVAVCPGLPSSPLLPLHESKQDDFWPLHRDEYTRSEDAIFFPTVQAHPASSCAPDSQSTQDSQVLYGASSQQRVVDQVKTDVLQLIQSEIIEPWMPGEYEIVLILDSREIQMKTNRTYIQDQLVAKNIRHNTRSLDLGDVVWIARKKGSQRPSDELFLDYVVERKRLDDLVSSIKDGRFTEQKQRLKRSGAKKAMYIVEEYSREEAVNFGLQAIQTAMSSTQIIDRIFLKRTGNIDETISYLISVTRMIERLYADKILYPIPEHIVTTQNYLALRTEYRTQLEKENTAYLISYPVYNQINSKNGSTNLHEIYLRMLMYIRGVNAEKALALIQVYPTPHLLLSAFRLLTPEEAKDLAKKATQNQISRRRWGSAVSERLYEVWGSLDPSESDLFSD